MRPWLLAILLCAFVLVGGSGAWSYAHQYYTFRGFPPPHDPPGVSAGKLHSVWFRPPSLSGRHRFDVYLPPGYDRAAAAGRRFPVLYLLHGSPGWPLLFINAGSAGVALDTLLARHAIAPMLIVLPDGRDGSFTSDTEWANTSHGAYERFATDTVHEVDRRFATLPGRAYRVLGGNSEGAYGAANVALRNLSTFGAFEAWSGYFRQSASGPFKRASQSLVRANSPADYVRALRAQLRRQPLAAFLYGGDADKQTKQLLAFATQLRAAGARVTAHVYAGRHDWRLWRSRTPLMLKWASEQMAGAR